MWRLVKFLFAICLLAGFMFVAYAYLGPIFLPGDFVPPMHEVIEPVTLGVSG